MVADYFRGSGFSVEKRKDNAPSLVRRQSMGRIPSFDGTVILRGDNGKEYVAYTEGSQFFCKAPGFVKFIGWRKEKSKPKSK